MKLPVHDKNHTVSRADYFSNEIMRLARFLRDNFPDEVRENADAPLERSSAVHLAEQLLLKYKTLKGKECQ